MFGAPVAQAIDLPVDGGVGVMVGEDQRAEPVGPALPVEGGIGRIAAR